MDARSEHRKAPNGTCEDGSNQTSGPAPSDLPQHSCCDGFQSAKNDEALGGHQAQDRINAEIEEANPVVAARAAHPLMRHHVNMTDRAFAVADRNSEKSPVFRM